MKNLKIREGVKLLFLLGIALASLVGAIDYFNGTELVFSEQFNWY